MTTFFALKKNKKQKKSETFVAKRSGLAFESATVRLKGIRRARESGQRQALWRPFTAVHTAVAVTSRVIECAGPWR